MAYGRSSGICHNSGWCQESAHTLTAGMEILQASPAAHLHPRWPSVLHAHLRHREKGGWELLGSLHSIPGVPSMIINSISSSIFSSTHMLCSQPISVYSWLTCLPGFPDLSTCGLEGRAFDQGASTTCPGPVEATVDPLVFGSVS